MTEPTAIRFDYLGVRARIVVNRHGDHWRASFARRWRDGRAFGPEEPLQALVHEGGPNGHKFPNRFTAIVAAVGTVVEEEDQRMLAAAGAEGGER